MTNEVESKEQLQQYTPCLNGQAINLDEEVDTSRDTCRRVSAGERPQEIFQGK